MPRKQAADDEEEFNDEDAPAIPRLKPIRMEDWTLYPNRYLGDTYDHIDDASKELPQVIDWCNEKLSVLIESRYLSQQECKQAEARAYFHLRNSANWLESGYAGKMTEDALKHAVQLDEKVIDAHMEVALYMRWVTRFQTILGALNNKLELVRSSESTRRKNEYQN